LTRGGDGGNSLTSLKEGISLFATVTRRAFSEGTAFFSDD
jgi:hypothetical protein